ncbi:hypothetical protein CHELA20_10797 [Hyphomicrobiales bacterium]|nr:hypothetical protein CHELA20_10797 [Hyphomicrobiales bacterium]CAH1693759.1 hypothetical protein CHELA41_51027 [Hyphomicrobiales bacterium]
MPLSFGLGRFAINRFTPANPTVPFKSLNKSFRR